MGRAAGYQKIPAYTLGSGTCFNTWTPVPFHPAVFNNASRVQLCWVATKDKSMGIMLMLGAMSATASNLDGDENPDLVRSP